MISRYPKILITVDTRELLEINSERAVPPMQVRFKAM